MIRPALSYCCAVLTGALCLASEPVLASTTESAALSAAGAAGQGRRKQAGDLSYQTMWRMQKRVSAMLPRNARVITPVLRLTVTGVREQDRIEFLPSAWGLAIIGKTVGTVLPMRRGGYFEVPAIVQAQGRQEEAIVRFNIERQPKSFQVAWQLAVPAAGAMPYSRLAEAFAEVKLAQQEMAWWDIMVIEEKNARFDAVRVCFTHSGGQILVDGVAAGIALSPHCTLLPYEPARAASGAQLSFAGAPDTVMLDRSSNYAPADYAPAD